MKKLQINMEDNINKYYTPEIEEFHVGFEFEYMSVETNGWVSVDKDMWLRPKGAEETHLLRSVNEWDRCIKHADLTKVRVKYLDREDIESLGWIERAQEYDDDFNDLNYKYFTNNNIMRLRLYSNGKVQIHNTHGIANGQKTTWFMGTLKNKSELVKILKQTDIQCFTTGL